MVSSLSTLKYIFTQPTLGRSKIRRFGTVLSVNSPGVTPSVQKKAKALRENLRKVSKPSIPEEETTSPISQQKEKRQFTVTFDAGPIGLQIDPTTCCVQCILGDDSPARTLGMILEGDVVVAVNGMPMVQDTESAEKLWAILQNVKTRRSITFERDVEGVTIVSVDGPENRSPSTDALSPLPPPRSILFLNDNDVSKEPTSQPSAVQPSDELALTRRELLGTTNLLEQMQAKLDALEAENAALKSAPLKQQPYHAIRDMEYKMRIHSLEDQLQQSSTSRSKLKEQLLAKDERLQKQTEHHKFTLDQTNQELQNALIQNKGTTQLLENTRNELTTAKKEWHDERNVLQQERDQLLERVDQHVIELERSRASKVQSDVRLQQLEEIRSLLEEELQRTRAKVEESDLHAQQNSEQLLHTIRTKDTQIEGLRMELVELQTGNATLQADLSEKDAVVRQVMTDTEQRSKDQQSLHQDLVNMTSLLEMSHQEKERLEELIAKLEDKLVERNHAMDAIKVTLKQVQDDFAAQIADKRKALAASAESIDELYSSKELLMRQLVEAQAASEASTQAAQHVKESLAAARLELLNLQNAAFSEKCALLKRLEELEGAANVSRATILRQEAALVDSALQLNTAQEHLKRVSGELVLHQHRLLEKEETIQENECEIVELKESLASKAFLFAASIQDLKEQLEQSMQVNDTLTKQNGFLTRRLDIMYKSLMSASFTELSLKAALKGAQAECAFLKMENNRLSLNVDELQGQVTSRDGTIESLRVDLAHALSNCESLQLDIGHVKLDLAKMESSYEESLLEVVRREAHYQSVLGSAYMEKERLSIHLFAQTEQVKVLNRTIEASATEASDLRKHLLELRSVAQSKEAFIAELQAKMVDLTVENESLQASSIQEKDVLTLQLSTYEKDIAFLQSRFSNSQEELLGKSSELASTKAEVKNLESELSSLNCYLREARTRVEEHNLLIESLNQSVQVKDREFQVEVLRKDELVADLRSQINEKDANLVESMDYVKTVDQELTKARSDLVQKQEDFDSLKAALEESQCHLHESISAQRVADLLIKSLNDSIERNQRELCGKTEEFDNLSKSYEGLKFDHECLKEQLVKTQEEYNMMSSELEASLVAINASSNRTTELETNILHLQSQFKTEISDKLEAISRLTEEKGEYFKELSETRDHIRNANVLEKSLRSEVEQLKFQLANSEADFQKCNELLDNQTQECEVSKQICYDQKLRCDKLLQELKQSESSRDSFSRLVDNQNSQIASLKQAFGAQKAEHDRELCKTQMESQERLFENRSLTERNSKLKEKLYKIEATIAKADDIILNLRRKISELESEHSLTVSRANRNEQDLLKQIDGLCQDVASKQSLLEERDGVIVDLKNKFSTLKSDYGGMSDQLSAFFFEKQELTRTALHFEMMLEVAKRNELYVVSSLNDDWTFKMDSLKFQYDILLSDADRAAAIRKAELDVLKTNFANQTDEVKSLRELLSSITSEKDALTANIMNIEGELRLRELDLSDAILRVETANKMIVKKSDCLENLERSLENARTKALEQEERYANLACDSSETRNSLIAEIIHLKGEAEALKSELKESGSMINSFSINQSDSELLVARLEEELRSGKEALNEITAKAAASVYTLECEVEASKSEINKYRDTSLKLTSECNDLRIALSALQSNLHDVSEMHSASQTKWESMEIIMLKRQEELLGQVEFASAYASKLSEELQVLKLEHESVIFAADAGKRQLEETIRLHQSEASLRLERQFEWNKKLEETRSGYHRCRTDLDIASNKITQLEGLVNNRDEEIRRLSDLLEKTIEENIASIESTSQCHSSEVSCLQHEIDDYISKLNNASATISSLTSRLRTLDDELSGVLAERNDLVSEKESLEILLEENNKVLVDLQRSIEIRELLSSESEIIESPFKSLSKHEIKEKCLDLQNQLQTTQESLSSSHEDLYRRSEHVRQLAHDLDAMSAEIVSLVAANEMLETRLKQVTSLNGSLESASFVASNKISFLENELQSKSKKLEQLSVMNCKLVDEIQSVQNQAKSEKLSIETEKCNAVNDLAISRQELEYAIARRDEAELLVSENRVELNLLRDVVLESNAKIQQSELGIAGLKTELTASEEQTVVLRSDLKKKIDHYTQHVLSLEAECETLRSMVTSLQLDVEEKDVDLRDKEEKVLLLCEDLLNQRQLTLSADQFRDDVVSKLSEATRVITAQRFMIKKLESRALDAERRSAQLSDRIDSMSSSSVENQANSVESDAKHAQLSLELEQKLKAVDEARASAAKSFKNAQDELQKVQMELSESEKGKLVLQKRIDELKSSVDTLRTHLSDSRIARDESIKTLHQLQAGLDNKRMDVDHLKASLQVSTATVARLKATALLQESESQTDKRRLVRNQALYELADLPLDQASSSKLSSFTEGTETIQHVRRLYAIQEEAIMRFVDDFLTDSDRVFGTIAGQSEYLFHRCDISDDLKALDLAGMVSSSNFLESLRTYMYRLSAVIASYFESRRSRIQVWRDCHSTQKGLILSILSSPHESAVHRMDLSNDDLSPRIESHLADQPDMDFFKSVIVSLEENIDALLIDLKAANEALQEKDFLLAKLESLVAFYESMDSKVAVEPSSLEQNSQSREHFNDPSEGSTKNSKSSERSDSFAASQRKDPNACKLVAGRLLLQALDGRAHAAKAIAFRQWACQTSAMSALAKHGSTAAALAQQLEETREKLVLLKRHLKKSRRSSTREYSTNLDRIEEHESEI
jgi:chromosome segregation ATPase